MKAFPILLMLVSTVSIASTPFEVQSEGCMFTDARAMCTISNREALDASCDIWIEARTASGTKIKNSKKTVVPTRRTVTIEALSTSSAIKSVSAAAVCRAKE